MKIGTRVVEVILKGTDQATGAFSGFQKQLGEMGKKFPVLAAGFDLLKNPVSLLAAGLIAVGNQLRKVVSESIDYAASMQDMADRTGLAAQALSEYDYVASQMGITVGDFESALTKLRRSILDAANDAAGPAADAFNTLGVSIFDAEGKMRPAEDVMRDISAAIQGLDADSKLAITAMDLMGKGSQGFISALRKGPEAMEAYKAELRALNAEVDAGLAKAADDAKDSSEMVKRAWQGALKPVTKWWAEYRADFNMGMAAILADIQGKGDEFRRAQLMKEAADLRAAGLEEEARQREAAAKAEEIERTKQARIALIRKAALFNVPTTEKKWSEQSGAFINVDRTSDAIATDILAAQKKAVEKAAAQAAQDAMAGQAAAAAPPVVLMAPDVAIKMEEKDKLETEAKWQALLKEVMGVDLSQMELWYGAPIEAPVKKLTAAQQKAIDIGNEMGDGLKEIGTTAIDAFLNGEAGAMKFGDMIRRTITRAIAEAIIQLLVLKAINAGLKAIGLSSGGSVPAAARGGRIPGYAGGGGVGYSVPDGVRGFDSRLIMAMPGEEVINRQLSQRLERFISSYELGAAVSPFALAGAGGGRGTVINFNVARPVNVLDALSLGRDAVTASRKYSEAKL